MSLRHRRNQVENLRDQLESIFQRLPRSERPREEREGPDLDLSVLHDAELARYGELMQRKALAESDHVPGRGQHNPQNPLGDCECGYCTMEPEPLTTEEASELRFYHRLVLEGRRSVEVVGGEGQDE